MMSLADARRHLPPHLAQHIPDERLEEVLRAVYAIAEIAVEARQPRHAQSPPQAPTS